jgi:hypothetical protein
MKTAILYALALPKKPIWKVIVILGVHVIAFAWGVYMKVFYKG